MPRRAIDRFQSWCCVVVLLGGITAAAATSRGDEPSLHERIDALIETAMATPVAGPAADADFLRRAWLDLGGTIPDAATARAFLDDPAPAKRAALVDRLLARPQFARHMAQTFDVMLMERRADKNVTTVEWREYLRQGFAANKPLDQLCREILAADGAEGPLRPAARFYLDRDGDSNLLARDIGRLFFGRDLQCAQCHDHPLVNDYLQSEYYGLMAFVSRGQLFTGTDKKVLYAETADGEVNYKSVFTGDARQRVVPKPPGGVAASEPVLGKEEQYVVAPAKDVRPIPKYSRRARLAAVATDGTNGAFNRNWANRLWAHMMGRGLVHPLDMQHSDNPSVESKLLALLADELVRMKFDTKAFLRELALTRAYQRTSELPGEPTLDANAAQTALAAAEAEAQKLAAELPALKQASETAAGELNTAYDVFSKAATEHEAAQKTRGEAKKASDDAAAALAAAIKEVATKEDIFKALAEARDKALAAAAKLPDDKPLAEAAGQFKLRAGQLDEQVAGARKTVAEKTAQSQSAAVKLAEVDQKVQAAAGEVTMTQKALDVAEAKNRDALEPLRAAKARHGELTARIADTRLALDAQTSRAAAVASLAAAQTVNEQLTAARAQAGATTTDQTAQLETAAKAAAEKAAADSAAAEASAKPVWDRSTARFTVAPLKPLSPEQMAWATMQAVGVVDAQLAAIAPQARKDAEAAPDLSPEARATLEQRLVEERVDEKLRGNLPAFVTLFGQQPGQAPSFQATVHQALFLSNGGLLAGWINPGGNNLTDRLSKTEDSKAVADELYLSVLSRRPTADEQAQVAAYWEAGKADRAAAARELVWSLLASTEFRFNH